jgi:hypothetical protein
MSQTTIQFDVTLPFHVLVYPAPDVEGQWIAHCLELDMIAQGDSNEHARAVLDDQFHVLLEYNLQHGLVPIQVRPAPPEIWEAAGLHQPDSLEVRAVFRTTNATTKSPLAFEGVPSFEAIVRDRAPVLAA